MTTDTTRAGEENQRTAQAQAQAGGPAIETTAPLPQAHPGARAESARKEAEETGRFVYIEVGPNVWGKGFTRDDAHRNAGRPKRFIVYACSDPWARITPMGDIEYAQGATYWEVARKPTTLK